MPVARKTFTRSSDKYEKRDQDYYRNEVENAINDIEEDIRALSSSDAVRLSISVKRNILLMKPLGIRSP